MYQLALSIKIKYLYFISLAFKMFGYPKKFDALIKERVKNDQKLCDVICGCCAFGPALGGAAGIHKLVEIHKMPKPHKDCSISLVL